MHGVSLLTNNIEKLLEDFHKITDIRIAFVSYDMKSWIEVPKEKSLFCTILRDNPSFAEKCNACDCNAFKITEQTGELYIYKCHGGLTEAVSPIIYKNKILGYLMMGQTLHSSPNSELWEKYKSLCINYNIDQEVLEKAFYQIKSTDIDRINSAARIMDMSAKYIHSQKLVKLKEPQLLEKIISFVEEYFNKPITIEDISKQFKFSSSYLRHIIKSNFKMSFTEYLMIKRIEKAKDLLEHGNIKINEVASQVGFQEQNYFSRVFKKHSGISPTEFIIRNTK
jgi:AraC-like DNA-binding protein